MLDRAAAFIQYEDTRDADDAVRDMDSESWVQCWGIASACRESIVDATDLRQGVPGCSVEPGAAVSVVQLGHGLLSEAASALACVETTC